MKTKESFLSVIPFGVGDAIFIRTVTHYHVGRVRAMSDAFIVLEEVSWVADTERFGEMLRTGAVREFECCPSWGVITWGSIVDIFPWTAPLPTETK